MKMSQVIGNFDFLVSSSVCNFRLGLTLSLCYNPKQDMETVFIENKKKYIGVLGAFALSVGTAIGWGSFVVTGSNYLSKAGLVGSIIGIVLGTLLMGIIAYCYHYMINKTPDSGGIYSFVKHSFNGDHAFLASWFLILIYIGILWANVTSVALFSRFLFGGVFQFGRLYSIAGFDVYIGEVLLCAGVLFLIGGLTLLNKKVTTRIAFGLVLIFVAAIAFVSLFSLMQQNNLAVEDVTFAPGGNEFGQITGVLAMSPWAFIGFESISHSAGSFSFKTKKVLWILLISLFVSMMVYIMLCQISVMAHPDNYSSWHDYIVNNHESGIQGIPPFFVAKHYLGTAGTVIFAIALFAIIATSIIGNIYAVSNLIQRMAEDKIFPVAFASVNKNDIPMKVRFFVIAITFFAIFLGRSAIGFIVDVNNIGGVIVYGYISACALYVGYQKQERIAFIFGILGLIASILFGVAYLAPVFTTAETIAQETFIVFVLCSLIGFVFFVFILRKDTLGNFGNSSVVWVGFSIMVTLFSGIWIIERSKRIHGEVIGQIEDYYASLGGAPADKEYLARIEEYADRKNMAGMVTLIALVSMTLLLLFLTLYLIKENQKKYKMSAEKASDAANRDDLTGVKNHRAYILHERKILGEVAHNPTYAYAIVVCDVNDLKYVNDRYGHDYGDEYLRKACRIICDVYVHSPVFRVGGDEFVVILEGDDFEHRAELLDKLRTASFANASTEEGIVIAVGMADNKFKEDFQATFRHADEEMYTHKGQLKLRRPSHILR